MPEHPARIARLTWRKIATCSHDFNGAKGPGRATCAHCGATLELASLVEVASYLTAGSGPAAKLTA